MSECDSSLCDDRTNALSLNETHFPILRRECALGLNIWVSVCIESNLFYEVTKMAKIFYATDAIIVESYNGGFSFSLITIKSGICKIQTYFLLPLLIKIRIQLS